MNRKLSFHNVKIYIGVLILLVLLMSIFSNCMASRVYDYEYLEELDISIRDIEIISNLEDYFTYEINSDGTKTCTITGCTLTYYTNTLPSTINGYTVTRIGDAAFKNNTYLISVITIPSTVTYIGEEAFYGCTRIYEIRLGSGVLTIGASAFESCTSLESITFNSSVTYLGDKIFKNCSALVDTSITIPSSVTYIGSEAFYKTGLSKITFTRAKAPTITQTTFSECTATLVISKSYTGYTAQNYWPVDYVDSTLYGDMNLNGKVNAEDAAIVLDRFKNNDATDEDYAIGDLNNDGKLNAEDAAMILDIYKNS